MHWRTALFVGLFWLAPLAVAIDQTAPSSFGDCAGIADLGDYTIRSSRVSDPFWMLRFRRLDAATLDSVKALQGKPYSFDLVNSVSRQLEKKGWLPDNPGTRVALRFSDIAIENCHDRALDVVFHIFSAQFGATAATVIESRVKEKTMPSEATGVSNENAAVKIAPEAGFEPGRNFMAGGRLEVSLQRALPFSSFRVRGLGSPSARWISSELAGQYDSSTSWLGHADWRAEFQHEATPAEPRELRQTHGAVQWAGATKPIKGAVVRFGGLLDAGTMQSSFQQAEVAPDTLASSSYSSARIAAGVTGRANSQAYAVSYGIGLGSTAKAFHGDWRKHVADVRHEFWTPFGDHRLFELEQRLTAGWIQTPGKIPVAERFFGGNREELFLDSDEWKLRSNPVIRSIPANRLYRTTAGAGGDRFVAYNSTAAFTVWRKALVPEELTKDEQFGKLLQGQVNTARSFLSVYYRSRDPHFTAVRESIPAIASKLADVTSAKDAAQKTAPAEMQSEFRPCVRALSLANLAVKNAAQDKPDAAYGWVQLMVPGGTNSLANVAAECEALAARVHSAALASAAKAAGEASDRLKAGFEAIDKVSADRKAAADTAFVDRTLKVVTRQMNITAVSPIALFDAARIGPGGGTRYGVGGGVRFTLASTVSFDVGYAVNAKRARGESFGAFFFAMTTRNLLE